MELSEAEPARQSPLVVPIANEHLSTQRFDQLAHENDEEVDVEVEVEVKNEIAQAHEHEISQRECECASRQRCSFEGISTRWRAIKLVRGGRNGKSNWTKPHDVLKESRILQILRHRNIGQMLEYAWSASAWEHRLIMPLYACSLRDILSAPSNDSSLPSSSTQDWSTLSRWISHQLLSAVEYLHAQSPPIAHRDINPSNILFDWDGTLKLVDFGTAWIDADHSAEFESGEDGSGATGETADEWEETREDMCCDVGTGPYRAPELLFSPTTYDARAIDLWAVGTVIAELLFPRSTRCGSSSITNGSESSSAQSDFAGEQPSLGNGDNDSEDEYDPLEGGPSPDPRARGRISLFDDSFGALGLAGSIFRIRGTPTTDNWRVSAPLGHPTIVVLINSTLLNDELASRLMSRGTFVLQDFYLLPDAGKISFPPCQPTPLIQVLEGITILDVETPHALALIDGFLALNPKQRISAATALTSPWFQKPASAPQIRPTSRNVAIDGTAPTTPNDALDACLHTAAKRYAQYEYDQQHLATSKVNGGWDS